MTIQKKTSWLAPAGGLLLAAILSLPAVGQTQPQYTPQNAPESKDNDAPSSPEAQQGQPPQSVDRNQQSGRNGEQEESGRQDVQQSAQPARPGAINYVEGNAAIDGQGLSGKAVGTVVLEKGQTLTTQNGKVEILLTPGVFLRVADNSALKMVSPDLANTFVELDKGRAMVEVTDISKQNNIRVELGGASTQLLKRGLYDFDQDHGQIRVLNGKAEVYANNQKVGVGENHEVTLNAGGKLKSQDFDAKVFADDFYRWSGLRSGYLAEADADTATRYVNGGADWAGSGWYWSPWFGGYTFIPGDGIFYSPFGWGFYSPYAVYGSPFFYGGYYGRRHYFGEVHGPYGHGFAPRGSVGRGGFHDGGGFHGGGGGFHGGGGGFHGGGGGHH
jgi:hypothetical protein